MLTIPFIVPFVCPVIVYAMLQSKFFVFIFIFQEEDSKKKKKVKLIAHDSQVFIDSNDVYVWIFDPTPLYKKVIGLLMGKLGVDHLNHLFFIVLGTIAGCLFPLWPDWLRLGVYYVSVVGICLFGLLLGVALG